MEKEKKILFKTSLTSAGLTALFWFAYSIIVGNTPADSIFLWNKDIILVFPVSISRWTDVIIGPTFCLLFYFFAKKNKNLFQVKAPWLLASSLFLGAVISLIALLQKTGLSACLLPVFALALVSPFFTKNKNEKLLLFIFGLAAGASLIIGFLSLVSFICGLAVSLLGRQILIFYRQLFKNYALVLS